MIDPEKRRNHRNENNYCEECEHYHPNDEICGIYCENCDELVSGDECDNLCEECDCCHPNGDCYNNDYSDHYHYEEEYCQICTGCHEEAAHDCYGCENCDGYRSDDNDEEM